MFPLSLNEPINKKDKDNSEALLRLEKHQNQLWAQEQLNTFIT